MVLFKWQLVASIEFDSCSHTEALRSTVMLLYPSSITQINRDIECINVTFDTYESAQQLYSG